MLVKDDKEDFFKGGYYNGILQWGEISVLTLNTARTNGDVLPKGRARVSRQKIIKGRCEG